MAVNNMVRVLDGSQIHASLSSIFEKAQQRFKELDTTGNGFLASADVKTMGISEASVLLLGLQGSAVIFDEAFKAIPVVQAESLNQEAFANSVRNYLEAIANALQDQPMVVTVLDGLTIKALLDDEDEFAMLAENLFEELDIDESGKLSRRKLGPAVMQLGLEQGVPPPAGCFSFHAAKPEADELITKLLQKYAEDGSEELGQAQFAALLQAVLQDLAESLALHPILIVQDVKVLNGSHVRKMLNNEQLLSEVSDYLFQQLDANNDGKLSTADIRSVFENQGSKWGLPDPEESAEINQLFNDVFKELDSDQSGLVEKGEFQVLTKALFEGFAEQLQLEPILAEMHAIFK